MRGFDRSISPPPLPPLVFPHIASERECEFLPGAHGYYLLLSRGYGGLRSQVVVSSLPPCSLSLLRRGAETGAVPARSPVPSLPGKMGLLVPNAAQAAPLQFSSCRWCSCLFSCNELWVQESQKLVQILSLSSNIYQNWLIFKLAHIILFTHIS